MPFAPFINMNYYIKYNIMHKKEFGNSNSSIPFLYLLGLICRHYRRAHFEVITRRNFTSRWIGVKLTNDDLWIYS